jgi:hypothetical protein
MKSDVFKKIIKEAVRETFQEEIKGILLEAIKNNNSSKINIGESLNNTGGVVPSSPANINNTKKDEWVSTYRTYYDNVILGNNNSDSLSFNTSDISTVPLSSPPMEGALPSGEVSLNQIMGLINKK